MNALLRRIPSIKSFLFSFILLSAFLSAARAQQRPQTSPPPSGQPAAATPAPTPAPPVTEVPPVVTKHELKLGEKALKYTITTGLMPIKNTQTGETEAQMFFIAYTLDGTSDPAKRRLMFSFNGGPGSASVWLHLGALGPKRVKMQEDGGLPAAPYELVPNEHIWLDQTDLVFIDPRTTLMWTRAWR